jgi:CheY-like chemotaxis protein
MLLKNKRVFIVEDNLSNRAITQLMLEQQGAKTAIDRWGKQVCQRLQEFAPVDLIMLDLMFPDGVSGYDVFDQIRAMPEFENVPIVAVSAADPSEALPRLRKKGFAGFISKPLDFNFPQQIAKILNGEQVWFAEV